MSVLNELINELEKSDISIELFDRLKDILQYGGWDDDDFKEFKKAFYRKIVKSDPNLTQSQIEQILDVIYNRGVLKLIDVLFLDGAAFEVQRETTFIKYRTEDYISYLWSSDKYKYSSFADTTFFFYNNNKLDKLDKSVLPKLRNEIAYIFLKYYSQTSFPEELGLTGGPCIDYAIKCNMEELIHGLNTKTPFKLSIICRIKNKSKIRKLDILCDLSKDKYLKVLSIDDNAIKLSEILKQNRTIEPGFVKKK